MGYYSLGLYEKAMPSSLSWEEKMLCAKEAGFDFIEISIDETDEKLSRLDMDSSERQEMVNLMQKTGIRIRSMCLSGHRKYPLGSSDTSSAEKSMSIMKKAIILASDLGIRIIQLAGYDVYYEKSTPKTVKLFEENLKLATLLAASYGIILAFETMETPFMDTVEKAKKYVDLMNSPFLAIYPDIGNLTNASLLYNSSVKEDILLGNGKITSFHLKETIANKYREIPFGTGHVGFEDCINLALSMDVRMFVAEFWYVGNDNWKEDLRFANEFLRSKFK